MDPWRGLGRHDSYEKVKLRKNYVRPVCTLVSPKVALVHLEQDGGLILPHAELFHPEAVHEFLSTLVF